MHQTVHSAAAWPLVFQKQRLPRKVFRSSIAWLSDSLSTLRRTGYPAATQDSLPAAGQALPDGLSTRKVPLKGFRVVSLHLIPLSQALLGTMKSTGWVTAEATKTVAVVQVMAQGFRSGQHAHRTRRQIDTGNHIPTSAGGGAHLRRLGASAGPVRSSHGFWDVLRTSRQPKTCGRF